MDKAGRGSWISFWSAKENQTPRLVRIHAVAGAGILPFLGERSRPLSAAGYGIVVRVSGSCAGVVELSPLSDWGSPSGESVISAS